MNTHMTIHSCLTAKKIPGHHVGKPPEGLGNPPIPDPVYDPPSLPAGGQDPGPSENGQVLGNIRLLFSNRHLDVADAPLTICEDFQDPKPCGLPYRLKEFRLILVALHFPIL